MSEIDPAEWSLIKASSGSNGALAAELLLQIKRGAGDDLAFGELYQQLCHQETVGEVGYVAIPHMAAIAASAPLHSRAILLSFVGSVVAHLHSRPEAAPPLRPEWRQGFLAGLQAARQLAATSLAEESLPTPDSFELLSALAALHGHTELAILLQEGPRMPCPECGKYMAPNAIVR